MVIVLGLPMKTLGLNLSCSPGPVRVDEGSYANPSQIPCFNLEAGGVVIVLGLPMKTLGLDLSCSLGPVRVDEGPYVNPSQIPCFNLLLQILS